MTELDTFVERHLNHQVKISYNNHHNFLVRHGLEACSRVLDIGTGNGTFVRKLAEDHPNIHFVGIDKRKSCIDSAQKNVSRNFEAFQNDMFSRSGTFDYSAFDGFLMRYFLLHVDNAQKILELLKEKSKRPSRFWIVDLDWSQITCEPSHETFDKIIELVKHFCSKVSVETRGGENVVPLLQKIGFQNIKIENIPFNQKSMTLEDLATYIKNEILCYSYMSGKGVSDSGTKEIIRFIDEDIRSGKYNVSYGMILISAEL